MRLRTPCYKASLCPWSWLHLVFDEQVPWVNELRAADWSLPRVETSTHLGETAGAGIVRASSSHPVTNILGTRAVFRGQALGLIFLRFALHGLRVSVCYQWMKIRGCVPSPSDCHISRRHPRPPLSWTVVEAKEYDVLSRLCVPVWSLSAALSPRS